jgi:hypothetical protein
MNGPALDHFVGEFESAMYQALALSSRSESVRNSEVEYIKADAIRDQLCDY